MNDRHYLTGILIVLALVVTVCLIVWIYKKIGYWWFVRSERKAMEQRAFDLYMSKNRPKAMEKRAFDHVLEDDDNEDEDDFPQAAPSRRPATIRRTRKT